MHTTVTTVSLPLQVPAPADLPVERPLVGDTLCRIDDDARSQNRVVDYYVLRYQEPVTFDFGNRRYENVRVFRFRLHTHSRLWPAVAVRRNAPYCRPIPCLDRVVGVEARYRAAALTAPPTAPLGQDAVLATLTAIQQLCVANGAPLSGYEVEYAAPVSFGFSRRQRFNEVTCFRFHSFRMVGSTLYVSNRRRARFSYPLPRVDQVVRVRPVQQKDDRFADFESFARRFDRRFVSEGTLRDLWQHGSGQHSGPFRPSDFKPIGPKGRCVVKRFLDSFQSLDSAGPAYNANGVLTLRDYSQSTHLGRDISIEHRAGGGAVYYSSEFPGCGNGSYYLLATPHSILHLEND